MQYKLPNSVVSKIALLAIDDFHERHRQTIDDNLEDFCCECALNCDDDVASDILNYHNPEDILRSAARSLTTCDGSDIKEIMQSRIVKYFEDNVRDCYNKQWEAHKYNNYDYKDIDYYFEYGLTHGEFA
jgi:hypothetical protein